MVTLKTVTDEQRDAACQIIEKLRTTFRNRDIANMIGIDSNHVSHARKKSVNRSGTQACPAKSIIAIIGWSEKN